MTHAITAPERDAIEARLNELGRSNDALARIAAEFGRAVSTIRKMGRRV